MKILLVVPGPLDDEGAARRRAEIPNELLGADTAVDCIPVKRAIAVSSDRDATFLAAFITEAALRAEDEGYDAVVVDSVFDPGLYPLRSRLSIPVIGPGLAAYTTAITLGKRFSILSLGEPARRYQRTLDLYDLEDKCASIRTARPTGGEDGLLEGLTAEARQAIDDDGADVIVLGSTTMRQASQHLASRLPCPVIDPGAVALKMAEKIVLLGLSHSKGVFPSPKRLQDDKFEEYLPLVSPPHGH